MQQKSNFVPGYQRARSELAIECKIFLTFEILVCFGLTKDWIFQGILAYVWYQWNILLKFQCICDNYILSLMGIEYRNLYLNNNMDT